MWAEQMLLLPGASHAPTLYGCGDTLDQWAKAALKCVSGNRVIVVGCSIGGSCAIEIAAAAPERIAALVLIGTKARHRPDVDEHRTALSMVERPQLAWKSLWAPLFSPSIDPAKVRRAKAMMLAQSTGDIARGVTAFHTRPDRNGFLSTFPGPLVVMTGALDRRPGIEISTEQARAAPRGELHIVSDCGHYLPLERPDYLNAVLRKLIAGERSDR